MPDRAYIRIEVAYATPDKQLVLPVSVPDGTTIEQAIKLSGILPRFPEIDSENLVAGIFSKRAKLDHVLTEGERVEIYRPLQADPRDVRRQLAEQGKTMGKARRTES
jgi:hypothetical protein